MSHDLGLVTREVDFDIKAQKKILENIKEVIRIIRVENWENKQTLKAKLCGLFYLTEEVLAEVGEYLENCT